MYLRRRMGPERTYPTNGRLAHKSDLKFKCGPRQYNVSVKPNWLSLRYTLGETGQTLAFKGRLVAHLQSSSYYSILEHIDEQQTAEKGKVNRDCRNYTAWRTKKKREADGLVLCTFYNIF
jgi:hypothetical protein